MNILEHLMAQEINHLVFIFYFYKKSILLIFHWSTILQL